VPLVASGHTRGVITFVSAETGHRYDEDAVLVATELARRAALAIDNARAHRELANERAWLRQVVDQMPAGVLIAEAQSSRIVVANEAAERALKRNLGGLDARDGVPLSHAGVPLPPERYPIARALAGEVVADEELEVDVCGRRVTMSVSAAPVRNAAGVGIAAVATFSDISDRKQAEARAGQEGEFRERFIGILAHDLRTPLSAIAGSADLLLRREIGEANRSIAARIAGSADRMARMINDVLDLTRARMGGGIAVAPAPVGLVPLCQQVVDELRVAHPGSIIEIEAEGGDSCLCDSDRVAQMVANLVANAIEHGRPGSPVRVRLADRGDHLELSVHNEGQPIPASSMDTLFDPFRRGRPAGHGGAQSDGLGLGLYIASEIVGAHRGAIAVTSSAEQGTTFTVTLPR
jgi:PAS domain S-box-containing protein